jgi:hypothetical protein
MGAWGIGTFENDDALDFVAELTAIEDLDFLRSLVEEVLYQKGSNLDPGLSAQALVAGEIIAALRGHPGALPEDVLTWIARRKPASQELRLLAHSAVLQVLNKSELRELWAETEEFDAWRAAVRDLLRRLSIHRPGPVGAVRKALKDAQEKVSPNSKCLCSFCGEIIPMSELTTLSIKGKRFAEQNIFAHASCLEDRLILLPRGDR